jgi:crotonobetainyl-CoA:carnitine CoA-transferase CaiB-like acyl-CoA transferase
MTSRPKNLTEIMTGDALKSSLLKGFRALDLTTSIAYDCGRMLAALGVDVIRIDSTPDDDKDKLKAVGPNTTTARMWSDVTWRMGNSNKRSAQFSLTSADGVDAIKKIAGEVDFIIESFQPGHLERLGLGFEVLSRINPRVVMASITPYGQTGPYATYPGSELTVSAMGGAMTLCGDPDRPPVQEALAANSFHACASALTGLMTAHLHRQRTGQGQHVDVAMQECAVARNTTGLIAWQFDQRLLKRHGPRLQFGKAVVRYVWPLADGYAIHAMVSGKMGASANRALAAWVSENVAENPMKDVQWETYDRTTHDTNERLRWEDTIANFFAKRTKEDVQTEGHRRGINAAVVNEPTDALQSSHLIARGHIEHLIFDGQEVVIPQVFIRTGLDILQPTHIPANPGEDQIEIAAEFGLCKAA